MTPGPVLILGAGSDIGRAIAHAFARLGHPIQLAARDPAGLERDRSDLELRCRVAVSLHRFDALALSDHEAFADSLPALPAVAVCVVGLMGDQRRSEAEPAAAVAVMRTNYEGPAHILAILANRFVARGSGVLVGISSVAGERGRASNYVYGSAKAGFTAFLSGLRGRLATTGVHVVTVAPGFVATRMTETMSLPRPLLAQPVEVADAVVDAVKRRRDVVYVRPIWRLVMFVIRRLPERVFKRLRF